MDTSEAKKRHGGEESPADGGELGLDVRELLQGGLLLGVGLRGLAWLAAPTAALRCCSFLDSSSVSTVWKKFEITQKLCRPLQEYIEAREP